MKRLGVLLMVSMVWVGCDDASYKNAAELCAEGSREAVIDGDTFCVFEGDITETGFNCPPALDNRIEHNGHVICAGDSEIPGERLDRAVEEAYPPPSADPRPDPPPNPDLPAGTNKVDILMVIDNSGSMCEEQDSVRTNISSLVDALIDAGVDFQVAVVTTDMENPLESGRFQNVPNNETSPACLLTIDISQCPGAGDVGGQLPPRILSSADYLAGDGPGQDALELHLGCNLAVGTGGTGFEAGLDAAVTAVGESAPSENAGFVRPDAHLAVFFVTDEHDCTDRGALDKINGNICEWESDQLVGVEQLVDELAQSKGGDRSKVIASGIIAPDDGIRYDTGNEVRPACFSDEGGEGYAGYRYEEFIGAFGGSADNVCSIPYDDSLERFAQTIINAVQ